MKKVASVTKIVAVVGLFCVGQLSAMAKIGEYANKVVTLIPNAMSYVIANTVGRVPTVKGKNNTDSRVKLADLYAAQKTAAFDYVFGRVECRPAVPAITGADGSVLSKGSQAEALVAKRGMPVFTSIHRFLIQHKTAVRILGFVKDGALSAGIVAGVYTAGKAMYNKVASKAEQIAIDSVPEDAHRKTELNA